MKTFLKQFENYEKRLVKKYKKKGITISVSGLSASGKTTSSKAIAKKLGLKYYSAGEIFRKIAKEKNISLEKFSEVRPVKLDLEIEKKTLELAIKGNVVLDGRMTGWIAGRWADVRIWYECPLKIRAERFAKREGINYRKAYKLVKERDEADRKKYMERYGIDVLDKSIYNIVVKNAKWSMKDAKTKPVRIVKMFLEGKDLNKTVRKKLL